VTVESILLYGAESWTTTKELNKEVDGTYTRLLRQMLNIDWRQHITNEELYADLPRISETIKKCRLRLAGHCWRSNEAAANLILWKPQHGQKKPGRQNWTTPSPVGGHRAQPRGIGYNDE